METKINIAEILKNKPEGTKLYSPLFGKCTFLNIYNSQIYISHHTDTVSSFYSNGTFFNFSEAEPLLFPSKEMRDWSKFTWKRGDVLINDAGYKVLFDKWENDDYTRFFGSVKVHCYDTEDYTLASKEEAIEFIKSIEKTQGGKLNLETLEIEKTQPEFKDGDIVFMKGIKSESFANCIFILKGEYKDGDERAFYYAFYNVDAKFTEAGYGNIKVHYSLRLATDSEKQQLFTALEKKGKAWDAEKKQIVDLKLEVKLKPFDKVLVRDSKSDYWRATLFSHVNENGCYYCVWASWTYCIPYEGNESLLGTNKNVES